MNHKAGDNIVKSYFEDRKIKPSDKAWDRLDAMMSVSEKDVTKKIVPIWWIRAAAGFIFIAISGVFLFYNLNSEDQYDIVNSKSGTINQSEKTELAEADKGRNSKVDNTSVDKGNVILPEVSNEKSKLTDKNISVSLSAQKVDKVEKTDEDNTYVAVITQSTEEDVNREFVTSDPAQPGAAFKRNTVRIDAYELLASVDQKPEQSNQIAEARLNSKPIHIDANKLLLDAEEDAAKGFLNKVFKTIHETSSNVLTSVNNRNHIKH